MTAESFEAIRSLISQILSGEGTHHDPDSITFGVRDGVAVAHYYGPSGEGSIPLSPV